MEIRTAVIAAAGLGTRFLPASKVVPKEMLPLVDRPILQHVIEETVASGIREIIVVIRAGARLIAEHFAPAPELEQTLRDAGKPALADQIRHIADLADLTFVEQSDELPYGNGSPLLAARRYLEAGAPFAYLFGDDVVDADPPGLRQLIDAFERHRPAAVMGTTEVPLDEAHLYACLELVGDSDPPQLANLVEKPAPGQEPSNRIQIGRFVVTPQILDILGQRQLGKGGELWMADAMLALARRETVIAQPVAGAWYTTGDPLRLLQTSIALALTDENLGPRLRRGLAALLA